MRFNKRALITALAAMSVGPACHSQSHDEDVGRTSADLTGARTFSISFPTGVGPDRVVLGADSELEVDDFASVSSTISNTLAINTAGSGLIKETSVGNRSTVTGIDSVASVELEDHTTVNGGIATSGTLTKESTDTISGTVTQQATLTPLFPVKWTATPPATNGGDVLVGSGNRTLLPGAYRNVQVFSGATLTLGPGSYFFEQLVVFPQANLVVNHQQQAVLVYVASFLQWQGTIQDGGDASHLLLGFNGNLAPLQSPFRGLVVAPTGEVQLFSNSSPHVGSFFGQSVEVGINANVNFVPFAHWGLFVAPILSVTCVMQYTATNFGALFGYTNLLSTPFTVPDGADNQFSPAVTNFLPLTTFAPGTHTGVTGVPLTGTSETWQVRNMSIQASRTTLPACTGDETRIVSLNPPDIGTDPDRAGPANPEALSRIARYTP
jgi:hypothetical protein